jgi:hypothetical protein
MPEKQTFEIPQPARACAKECRTSAGSLRSIHGAMVQAVSVWSSASSDTVTSAFKGVQDGAIRFAKENAEAGFALANELTKAKDLQETAERFCPEADGILRQASARAWPAHVRGHPQRDALELITQRRPKE